MNFVTLLNQMSDISLSCRNLVKFLGEEENRVQALKNVSLELSKGKVYSIVGPSGCGKSSLLYLLGLLYQPDSGEIYIGEKQSAHLTEDEATRIRNEHLGFIFQIRFFIEGVYGGGKCDVADDPTRKTF